MSKTMWMKVGSPVAQKKCHRRTEVNSDVTHTHRATPSRTFSPFEGLNIVTSTKDAYWEVPIALRFLPAGA